jgi:hypothetical protein
MKYEKAFNVWLRGLTHSTLATLLMALSVPTSFFAIIIFVVQSAGVTLLPNFSLGIVTPFLGTAGILLWMYYLVNNCRHPSPYDMVRFAGVTEAEWRLLSLEEDEEIEAIIRNSDYAYMATMLTRSIRPDQFLRQRKLRHSVRTVCRIHGSKNSHIVALLLIKGVPLSVLINHDLDRVRKIIDNGFSIAMLETLLENDIDIELSKSFISGTLFLSAA